MGIGKRENDLNLTLKIILKKNVIGAIQLFGFSVLQSTKDFC